MKKIIFMSQKKRTKRFKVGDLVRVDTRTHDEGMPKNRLGHIIADYRNSIHFDDSMTPKSGAWELYMTNGTTLIFHEMFLEHVDKAKE